MFPAEVVQSAVVPFLGGPTPLSHIGPTRTNHPRRFGLCPRSTRNPRSTTEPQHLGHRWLSTIPETQLPTTLTGRTPLPRRVHPLRIRPEVTSDRSPWVPASSGGCGAGGRALATVFGRSAWLGVESPEWWRASGGGDVAVPSGLVGFVWCA